jgi:predicted acylesterase/phospholipase RssA
VIDTRPDILVLGGGGRAADAWMTGVLAGIEDASGFDLSGCDYFVGTSAGAVVATRLVAGERLRRPALDETSPAGVERAPEPNAFTDWALALVGPAASVGMRVSTAPAAWARAAGLWVVSSRGPLEPLSFAALAGSWW